MVDFDDIPDLPDLTETEVRAPIWRGAASPTRREVQKRKTLALVASAAWIATQFVVFGIRGDLQRLPAGYILVLILGPLSAGCLAISLATMRGRLGLGVNVPLVRAMAIIGPAGFVAAGLLMPPPYTDGPNSGGGLMIGAYCFDCTLVWALLPIVAAGLSLQRSFVAGATWRSALLGTGCGLVAAAMFNLHCPIVNTWHIALAHGGAVLLSAGIGGICLPWATRT